MKNYNTVEEIYANNFCSERIYKRTTCPHLAYTEGVMDLMEVFNAHWIVDNVISYMQQVLKTLKRTEDTFYVVQIAIKQDNSGFMEVYHEGYFLLNTIETDIMLDSDFLLLLASI